MKIRYLGALLLLIAAGSFLAGYWVNHNSGSHKPTEERRILYYVDPMNPPFKTDKPGVAPCGIPLEPVYADQSAPIAGGADSRAPMPPGTVRIPAEKQQLIGVKVMTVEKAPWSHTLRVLGRVTPDEARVYRINAAINGWIVDVFPATTGSMVRKDALLATFAFLAPEFRAALQAYINIVSAANPPDQKATGQQVRESENVRLGGIGAANWPLVNLFSYGITESQLEEIRRTKKFPSVIQIRAPISGFILARNVSPDLRFDRGVEFYRIADLSRVWILADVFENEASFFKPGMRVRMELPYQKKILYARMSNVLPQFDPSTRTLKIRLEAENPGYVMRPDMFVNVELQVSGPPAIVVPVDAVLDSGLKKTVFVDRGNNFFEPRQVETGRALGERVEIARGLMPGEKIVVSGNFLLDSEARLQLASTKVTGKIGRDPVCGMNLDEDQSRATGNFREYQGRTYFFCRPECRDEFMKDPERYLKSSPATGNVPQDKPQAAPKHKHAAHDAATKHMSHDHTPTPMTGDMKAMPPAKGRMTMPKSSDPKQVPGSGGSMIPPGSQGPAPIPGAGRGGASSPASPGTDIKSIPEISVPVPGTTTPSQTRGARPLGSTVMPGPQDVPATRQPKTDAMIPPGTGVPPAEIPQKDTLNGGKAHD